MGLWAAIKNAHELIVCVVAALEGEAPQLVHRRNPEGFPTELIMILVVHHREASELPACLACSLVDITATNVVTVQEREVLQLAESFVGDVAAVFEESDLQTWRPVTLSNFCEFINWIWGETPSCKKMENYDQLSPMYLRSSSVTNLLAMNTSSCPQEWSTAEVFYSAQY